MHPLEIRLPAAPAYTAPDGSEVRLLVEGQLGSMAHFRLTAGRQSKPCSHRTIEELWFFTAGRGEFWRLVDGVDHVLEVSAGMSLRIPVRTPFQFRSLGPGPLEAVGVSLPPWPGAEEACAVEGYWPES